MERNQGNQKINCSVTSCRYNDMKAQECELQAIVVKPCVDCDSGKPEDESMCGSYRVK